MLSFILRIIIFYGSDFLQLTVTLLTLDLMANLSVNNYRLPTQEDFNGAMTAVMRLQDTYDLQPHELASGNLGKEKSLSMDGERLLM